MFKFIKGIIQGILNIRKNTEEFTRGYYITNETMNLLKRFEGCSLEAYEDTVGVWTIGYGNTFYQDGSPVKQGDTITRSEAEKLLKTIVEQFADQIDQELKTDLNDCQFGALLCFTYNVGIENLRKSTLLKKVNIDPSDPNIRKEFKRWVRAGGKTVNGLVKRREEEANYYFSETCA
jgi:lysozyme